MATTQTPPYTIGVLIQPSPQLLDLSSIDLFGMLSKSYLDTCPLPAPLLALAHPNIHIHYISALGPGGMQKCTADVVMQTTHSFSSEEVKPGKLDVLMVPGPEPRYVPSEEERGFIKAHFEKGAVILSVCTGIFAVAYSNILENQTATGPRGLLGDLKKKFPKTNWVEKRWVESGKGRIWISAGITNGHDMVAAYLHSEHAKSHGVSTQLADLVQRMADVGDRGQEYGNIGAGEGVWWVWLILRSLWRGKGEVVLAVSVGSWDG
ncbi:hypothetical protein PRZ48_008352 [Zasmidium cellare]|uniref:DJ-1/PfpI domain-containing protein n=1 Tax=Zasmidium cellare TaxID=395010 RepID=A0ABR0EG01_ZASCE|nr:hypothetical protein PRZ48_008352 [Zasmidium cellare]